MDMFMDKLAQKLNAQEMIKANLAADAEEMNQLKSKVKEYSDCLEQVQKLAEAGIVNGMDNGTFAPKSTATRAQAAQILYNLLGGKGGNN